VDGTWQQIPDRLRAGRDAAEGAKNRRACRRAGGRPRAFERYPLRDRSSPVKSSRERSRSG
jgi:hypothetical protein